jgi:hypothetical protein
MKLLLALSSIFLFAVSSYAQDVTVHVVEEYTKHPLKDIYLNLRIDCENPHRPKALQQKTDATGTAVFQSVSIAEEPVCIDLFSIEYAYAPRQLDYVFISPDKADHYQKSLNPIITTLPAEITFRVRKRSLGERPHFMFIGD